MADGPGDGQHFHGVHLERWLAVVGVHRFPDLRAVAENGIEQAVELGDALAGGAFCDFEVVAQLEVEDGRGLHLVYAVLISECGFRNADFGKFECS